MKKIPELLAPAGDKKSVRAALAAGADAVYFGGNLFNARMKARNFTREDMAEIIAICHQNGVKCYLTLNTLILQREWPELARYVAELSTLGLDGLIVQDPGLIFYLTNYYPELSLQTSTQASLAGLEGVRFFEDLGFSRVVLPREMPLSEVKTIAENTDVEIKIFNHGAMCYCRSGQCLMSSLIGARSGNRGLCAQPCRKKYALIKDGEEKPYAYRLSMKDLNTVRHMPEIIDAGVGALKIEGRLKSPEYIYAVVSAYRQALTLAEDGKNRKAGEKALDKASEDMAAVFHRGFTQGRLFEEYDVINPTIQKHYGRLIGTVKACSRGRLTIALNKGESLSVGDGLAFGTTADTGTRVDKIISAHGGEAVIPVRIRLQKGQKVYRNYDAALNEKIQKRIETAPIKTKIPAELNLTFKAGHAVKYRVTTPERVLEGDMPDIIPGQAQSRPLTDALITAQMKKTGDSLYCFSTITAAIEGEPFLSKKELNAVRREILARLSETKSTPKTMPELSIPAPYGHIGKPKIAVSLLKKEDFSRLWPLPVDEWIIPLESPADIDGLMPLIASAHSEGQHVVLAFPQVMNTAETHAFRSRLDEISALGPDGFLARDYEAFALLRSRKFRPEIDATMHVTNAVSAAAFEAWGASAVTLSVETDHRNMREVIAKSPLPVTVVVYGRLQIMISDHCLLDCEHKNCPNCKKQGHFILKDERGACFPGYRDSRGKTRLFNSATLRLTSRDLKPVSDAAKYRLDITDETREEARLAILALTANEKNHPSAISDNRQPDRRYTKGNYDRGVK